MHAPCKSRLPTSLHGMQNQRPQRLHVCTSLANCPFLHVQTCWCLPIKFLRDRGIKILGFFNGHFSSNEAIGSRTQIRQIFSDVKTFGKKKMKHDKWLEIWKCLKVKVKFTWATRYIWERVDRYDTYEDTSKNAMASRTRLTYLITISLDLMINPKPIDPFDDHFDPQHRINMATCSSTVT